MVLVRSLHIMVEMKKHYVRLEVAVALVSIIVGSIIAQA
jgi:hypothetical protein